MAEVIKMPRMSDTMTEGVIVSWLKKEGDKVKSGDILAEVETDKATMELESYSDGVLLHIGVQEGESVAVNGVLAVIGKEGEDYKEALAKEQGSAPQAAAPQEAAPQAQQPQAPQQPQPQMQQPQQPMAQPAPQKPQQQAPQMEAGMQDDEAGRVKASPLAKKLAEEKGINLGQISGSGDQGRIVRRDIEGFAGAPQMQAGMGQQAAQPQMQQQQTFATPQPQGAFEDFPVSQMRKTIARRLAESKFSAPHFYLTVEVNMGRTMEFRKRLNEVLGEKVSFNDIVIKATAAALKRHPKVNSSWLGDKIRSYSYVNMGVAIAVEEGLVVPVIRNAEGKGISAIGKEVKEYAEKAKAKKLQPQDFEGNTFTISNLGMFGIDEFTAIINPPDACILAVGGIKQTPIVENGEIKIGNVMKITLSCDHRVVDGATGAQFLQTLKQYLEEPVTILS